MIGRATAAVDATALEERPEGPRALRATATSCVSGLTAEVPGGEEAEVPGGEEAMAAASALISQQPDTEKGSLGGRLLGALSGLAGVVAQAASAAGLERVAESLAAAAASERAGVAFDEGLESAPEGPGKSLAQRLRSGVRRSLSMSRRMRFEGDEDADMVEGLHFNRTERQLQLRTEATAFAAEVADPRVVMERETTGTFPKDALAAAARRGYGRMLVPKARGGMGLGMDASCSVFEALGATDLPLAGLLAAHNAANYMLSAHGTSKIHAKLVRQMSTLTSLGALAVSEAPGGSDLVSTTTFVEKDVSGLFYTLSGSKAWVAGGAAADVFLVLARSNVEAKKGLSMFVVTKNMPGVAVGKPEALTAWRSCPVVPLSFNRVVVRTEYRLGREGQGVELLETANSLLRTWLAAAAVSYGEAMLTSAIDAAGGGVGGAIGAAIKGAMGGDGGVDGGAGAKEALAAAFGGAGAMSRQAHQTDVVKARSELLAARLLYRAAAQQLDCKAPTAACDACTAKIYALRAAQRAAETAVRVLGWRAVRPDQPCHAMLRNLQAADFVGGPPDALYSTIFSEMCRMSAS